MVRIEETEAQPGYVPDNSYELNLGKAPKRILHSAQGAAMPNIRHAATMPIYK